MALPAADHAEHLNPKAIPTGIASIMVHVDFDRGSDDRIRIASDLADRFGAVLIGVTGWVPGESLELGRVLRSNQPKLGSRGYQLSRIAWPNGFAALRARPSTPWSGGRPTIFPAR